jgi:hypothetical protein
MSKTEKPNEEQVFKQEVSDDELEAVAGGGGSYRSQSVGNTCVESTKRNIYSGGFPNCAATVEDGSWCWDNDACRSYQGVYYTDMNNCNKAWD